LKLAYIMNLANDAYNSCKGLRKLGVDCTLFYLCPTYVTCLPEWEDAVIDESKLGIDLMKPDLTAFKWNRPEWIVPFVSIDAGLNIAREILTGQLGYDLVVGHFPFPYYLMTLAKYYKLTLPYVYYEAGMIRNFNDPYHDNHETLGAYVDAPLVVYANVDMEPYFILNKISRYSYVPLAVNCDKYVPKEIQHDHTIFLHPTRHWHWEKGNDKVIAAFAEYVKTDPSAELRMCAWGAEDLEASKLMVYRYNISQNVTWLPILCKAHLIEEYQRADAVFDQFTYAATGTTSPEAMSCGKPVCSHIDPELFMRHHGSVPPIQDALDSVGIYKIMLELKDPGYRKWLGEQGRAWVLREQSLPVVAAKEKAIYTELLENMDYQRSNKSGPTVKPHWRPPP
jgi:glycosyltransferase involved in cell wall biosynthesis